MPSFDLTDPRYYPQRYWRGPTWLNANWLLIKGLQTHGRKELARKLTDAMIRLTDQEGLRGYFKPHHRIRTRDRRLQLVRSTSRRLPHRRGRQPRRVNEPVTASLSSAVPMGLSGKRWNWLV